ncbi:acyltransferase [Kribbella sp. NPDC051770]|uniref:acyltransferase family protein n=1 Tax=Kribbella sp. NPDC051770 TaxID=3155413 RepID=UPI003415FA25
MSLLAGEQRAARVDVGRLYEIDLLRIFAAVSVVLYHYLFAGYYKVVSPLGFEAPSLIARYGYLGVDLFFMISGFVVLLSAWDRTPRSFLVSRVVRLYPAYWVAVSLTALVSVLFGAGRFPIGFFQYVGNLTMFNSLANLENVDVVYWTLWAELRFYAIILALTFFTITTRRVGIVLWTWLGLTAVYELGVLPSSVDLVLNTQFSHYFIAGMALCMVYRFGPRPSWLVLVGLCLVNAVHRGIQFAGDVEHRFQTPLHTPVVVAAIVLVFAVMIAVALRLTTRLARPWFVALGALTYPLYLIHAHIGFIIFERLGNAVNKYVLVGVTCLVMVAAAYLIHRYVEKPLAPRLKRVLG